jgi:predicted metalloprotease with PDZ domain
VLEVEAESAAERAGIRGGDVIVALNGVSVAGSDEVAEELSKLDKGDSLSIEIVRKGIRKSLTLEIEQAMGLQRLFISPFEQGKDKVESFEWKMKDSDEAAKLKEEMKALKERLKELEDRLDKAEKRE